MAKMKSKRQLAEWNIQKMIQEYWETFEKEQSYQERSRGTQAVRVPREIKSWSQKYP